MFMSNIVWTTKWRLDLAKSKHKKTKLSIVSINTKIEPFSLILKNSNISIAKISLNIIIKYLGRTFTEQLYSN